MKSENEKSRYPPRGLCRYCLQASYQDDNYAVCAGIQHNGKEVKRNSLRSACKDYELCIYDVFSPDYMPDGELHEYTPRESHKNKKETDYEQLTFL